MKILKEIITSDFVHAARTVGTVIALVLLFLNLYLLKYGYFCLSIALKEILIIIILFFSIKISEQSCSSCRKCYLFLSYYMSILFLSMPIEIMNSSITITSISYIVCQILLCQTNFYATYQYFKLYNNISLGEIVHAIFLFVLCSIIHLIKGLSLSTAFISITNAYITVRIITSSIFLPRSKDISISKILIWVGTLSYVGFDLVMVFKYQEITYFLQPDWNSFEALSILQLIFYTYAVLYKYYFENCD